MAVCSYITEATLSVTLASFFPFHAMPIPFLSSVWRKPCFMCDWISCVRCDWEGAPSGSCHRSRQLPDGATQGAENEASHHWWCQVSAPYLQFLAAFFFGSHSNWCGFKIFIKSVFSEKIQQPAVHEIKTNLKLIKSLIYSTTLGQYCFIDVLVAKGTHFPVWTLTSSAQRTKLMSWMENMLNIISCTATLSRYKSVLYHYISSKQQYPFYH